MTEMNREVQTELRRLTGEFEELVAVAGEQLRAIEQALDNLDDRR